MAESWEVTINDRQPPMKVLDAIGVKPGMVIGEVGAGTGRVTVWLADRVGPGGRVYANVIYESALRHLKARCDRAGLKNVTTISGESGGWCIRTGPIPGRTSRNEAKRGHPSVPLVHVIGTPPEPEARAAGEGPGRATTPDDEIAG